MKAASVSLVLSLVPAVGWAIDDCWAVRSQASSPGLFTEFVHLRDDSTVINPGNYLYPTGAVCYGATFMDGVFYGSEYDGVYRLVTIPLTAFPNRTQVGPIGFPNVEALASVEGQLIAASLKFTSPHHTRFLTVDAATGAGSLIGVGSTDVMIVGLAYDPVTGVLYGVSMPYATVSGYNLYTIDPATGATTFAGNIGHPVQSLTVSPSLGLVGAMGRLISIDPATGAGTPIGATDYTNGAGVGAGVFNGLYALASPPPAAPAVALRVVSITRTPEGAVELVWTSEPGYSYQLKFGSSLTAGALSPVTGPLPGTAGTMSFMHTPEGEDGFYVVERTGAP